MLVSSYEVTAFSVTSVSISISKERTQSKLAKFSLITWTTLQWDFDDTPYDFNLNYDKFIRKNLLILN